MLKQKSFYVNDLARTAAPHIYGFLSTYLTVRRAQLMSASSSAVPASLRVANNEGGKSKSTPLSSEPHCSEGPWWALLDKVKRRI